MSNAKRRLENVGLDDDESDDETVCYFGSDGSDESVTCHQMNCHQRAMSNWIAEVSDGRSAILLLALENC